MSNYFKQNSRFGTLNEEIKELKKDDRKTKDKKIEDKKIEDKKIEDKRNDYNKRNDLSYRERQFANSAFKEEQFIKNEKKRLEEEKQKNLSIESFPELVKSSTTITNNNNMPSFLEKITTKVEKKEEYKSEKQFLTETLKPGWALFTFDKEQNKISMIENRIIRNEQKPLSELDITYNVFDALVNLHKNRREEYINNWGEDEFEKTFIFPNYDYEYFDKLDEKYEEDMRKYNNTVGGEFQIALDSPSAFFENMDIFVKDNYSETYCSLFYKYYINK